MIRVLIDTLAVHVMNDTFRSLKNLFTFSHQLLYKRIKRLFIASVSHKKAPSSNKNFHLRSFVGREYDSQIVSACLICESVNRRTTETEDQYITNMKLRKLTRVSGSGELKTKPKVHICICLLFLFKAINLIILLIMHRSRAMIIEQIITTLDKHEYTAIFFHCSMLRTVRDTSYLCLWLSGTVLGSNL